MAENAPRDRTRRPHTLTVCASFEYSFTHPIVQRLRPVQVNQFGRALPRVFGDGLTLSQKY
jgi:hypothetical protein